MIVHLQQITLEQDCGSYFIYQPLITAVFLFHDGFPDALQRHFGSEAFIDLFYRNTGKMLFQLFNESRYQRGCMRSGIIKVFWFADDDQFNLFRFQVLFQPGNQLI